MAAAAQISSSLYYQRNFRLDYSENFSFHAQIMDGVRVCCWIFSLNCAWTWKSVAEQEAKQWCRCLENGNGWLCFRFRNGKRTPREFCQQWWLSQFWWEFLKQSPSSNVHQRVNQPHKKGKNRRYPSFSI
ncbi:uncharacterized protein LOC121758461 isoform X3 [Salvia splendens]|uniref:uncharacterized protein LOC121758461 isoform X3 n=1 Tax=Salvia splendens TaxID=180675 RepID=UPI001C27F037|nr:uncharacterized protein LOC121758461 isoform X3 [Salvia splendens]